MNKFLYITGTLIIMGFSTLYAGSWHERPDRMFHANPLVEIAASERVFSRAKVVRILRVPSRRSSGLLRAQITTGEFSGQDVHAKTFFVLNARDFAEGDNILLSFVVSGGEPDDFLVDSRDRMGGLALMLILFSGLAFIVGGKRVLLPMTVLPLSIFIIWKFIGAATVAGGSPLISALISAGIVLILTISSIGGFSKKTLAAAAGAFAGLAFAGFASLIFIHSASISGFFLEEIRLLNYHYGFDVIHYSSFLGALIILGATGVSMDTSVSIASTMSELKRQKPQIDSKRLQSIGMRVGQDISATMSNTLIVAYLGSSLIVLMARSLHISSPIQLINADFFHFELYRALFGTCAFLIASRVTAWVGSKII